MRKKPKSLTVWGHPSDPVITLRGTIPYIKYIQLESRRMARKGQATQLAVCGDLVALVRS